MRGELIDSRDIRKHANDVLKLSQLLAPGTVIDAGAKITADLNRFLGNLVTDGTVDPRALGLRESLADLVTRIRAAYA